MVDYLIIAGLIAILALGLKVLERLPKPNRGDHFAFELPDDRVTIKIDAITEGSFELAFIDKWNVGRSFMIGGTILRADEGKEERLFQKQERMVVHIAPSADWFSSSAFGRVKTYSSGNGEVYIWPPYQIANRILDEVRREPNQFLTIGFKKEVTKQGKEVLLVYSCELDHPI